MPETTVPIQPPQVPDHELLCCVGRGSYGEVWLARSVMGTYRAAKIVSRHRFEHERPFEREFSGIQKFEPVSRTHPGLVSILHVGRNTEAGYFYYVMEVADDRQSGQRIDPGSYAPRTLLSELAQRGRLPVAECLEVGLRLTEALGHLHRQGLVHRDIKPANIIYVQGQPKFADIGLVTDIGDKVTFVGTEGYLPPEGPGTPAADLYSLGKVLYEISMGKGCQYFPELPSRLRELADAPRLMRLNSVILKACEGEVRRRYQSAEEMHAALSAMGHETGAAHALSRTGAVVRAHGSAAKPAAAVAADTPGERRFVILLNSAQNKRGSALIEDLSERLVLEGVELHIDEESVPGVGWAREIEAMIGQADAVVALLPGVGGVGEMVAYGLEIARQTARYRQGKPRLLPVLLGPEGTPSPALKAVLGSAPALHWGGDRDNQRVGEALMAALKS